MKFLIAEKFHEEYLQDVVAEIIGDDFWREKLMAGEYDEKMLLTYKELEEVPCTLWTKFSKYGLEYFVSKVRAHSEEFSAGTLIIRFEAKDFTDVVSYSRINQE